MGYTTHGEVITMDGKILCSFFNKNNRHSTIHMISGYMSISQLLL